MIMPYVILTGDQTNLILLQTIPDHQGSINSSIVMEVFPIVLLIKFLKDQIILQNLAEEL